MSRHRVSPSVVISLDQISNYANLRQNNQVYEMQNNSETQKYGSLFNITNTKIMKYAWQISARRQSVRENIKTFS